MTLSLEPFIQIETQNERDYETGYETTPFLLEGSEWAKSAVERFRKSPRRVPVFLEKLDGQSVFVCRYLTPVRPPGSLSGGSGQDPDKAIERAARYVSLIPWIDDSQLFKDMPDLTCLCQEFLDLGMGDSEEHAILLCNMFNHLDRPGAREAQGGGEDRRESYIVYGQAVPDGNCWYVARRQLSTSYVELWDPRSGECYVFGQSAAGGEGGPANAGTGQRAHDPLCPLKKIWAIVGQENVWANIQQAEAPALLSFNLDEKKCWSPFLDDERRPRFFGGGKVQDDRKLQVNAPELKVAPPAPADEVRRLE